MSNRIVGPTGMPLDGEGKSKAPTMEERLTAAIGLWQKGQKDVAFATSLNCIAYLSHGLAGCGKLIKNLEDQVKELTAQVKLLTPPTTPPNVKL